MPDVAFFVDAPTDIALAEGDAATSRVQIAKTGNFEDPRYGKFSITTADFDRWQANFATLSVAGERAGLPVDIDHGPEKTGNTEAAGWIVKLDRNGKDGKSSTPNELWATVEWNTLGAELVRDKRYLYLSPSYQHNYKDEHGKSHGTALVGVALTNRPFLTMATVSLSRQPEFARETEAYSPAVMPTFIESVREALGLSADAEESKVLSALATRLAQPVADPNATPGDVNLAALAQAQGMVVLSAADHLKLAADAAAGATAAKELHQSKFDNAWNAAVSKGSVLPAMEATFKLSYEADADATLKTLSELPSGTIPMSARGHTGDPAGSAAPVRSTTLSEASAEGWDVDQGRDTIADRAEKILSENPDIDYVTALERAAAEVR